MDLKKLQAEHPSVYAAAIAEGHEQGVSAERDRAGAHLTMGESSGAMDTAVAAVLDGSPMSQTLAAKYQAAGMNRASIEAREAETEVTEEVVAEVKPAAESTDKPTSLIDRAADAFLGKAGAL